MSPREFFKAGKLNETVQALSAELRDNPTDAQRRTFLFELLCFSGDFERARKHLELLAKSNQQAGMGALLYEGLMNSERTRNETFEKKDFPLAAAKPSPRGKLTLADGSELTFESFADADPRVGARLEVFSAGSYVWIPFEHIEAIEVEAPKRLRDLLWTHVIVHTGPSFNQVELGECYIPVLYAFSFKHPDDLAKLGRSTVWEDESGEQIPYGQRLMAVDGEDIPLLQIRKVEFEPAAAEGDPAASAS